MTPNNPPPGPSDAALSSIVVNSGYGGLHATILSAFALVLSAFSLYEASFKTADLEIFIPPVIQYARDGGGDTELFVVPITVTNSGARTGTVLSMELAVERSEDEADEALLQRLPRRASDRPGRAQPLVRAAVALPGTARSATRCASIRSAIRCRSWRRKRATTASRSASSPRRRPRPDLIDRVLSREAGTGRLRAHAALGLRAAARLATHHDLHAREGVERRAGGGKRRELASRTVSTACA